MKRMPGRGRSSVAELLTLRPEWIGHIVDGPRLNLHSSISHSGIEHSVLSEVVVDG
jgi:hypothetical protein